jgi:Ala-tRNA(Pro) deacylase
VADETPNKVEAVSGYLNERGIQHEVVEHDERFTAAGEARASGIGPEDAAKDVVLRRGTAYVLAVIPASERLDLRKAAKLLDDEGELRLATEEEIASDFSQFEVGALPPFGPLLGIAQIVDRRLLDIERVLCSSGDHRHSLKVDPNEMVRLADARVGDLCQD